VELTKENLPRHVAIIMDGNGRWAKRQGLKRYQGHEKGADTVRMVVRTTRELGIPYLTLYAFSEENWKRSYVEIQTLMRLLNRFLRSELKEMMENGIRLLAMGRLYKLPPNTQKLLQETMEATSKNKDMTLILALSYGGRQEILEAVNEIIMYRSTHDQGEIT
jgi:undecaprenyl diphosphate synthase